MGVEYIGCIVVFNVSCVELLKIVSGVTRQVRELEFLRPED